MDVRHAAGFVLYSEEKEGRLYLLLQNSLHMTWGFPKGHREPDEDDMTCARRELEEETGLERITVDEGFDFVTEHTVRRRDRKWKKIVTYYLARLDEGEPVLSEEHSEARWLPYEQALATLQYENLRRALKAAHHWTGTPDAERENR